MKNLGNMAMGHSDATLTSHYQQMDVDGVERFGQEMLDQIINNPAFEGLSFEKSQQLQMTTSKMSFKMMILKIILHPKRNHKILLRI